MISKLRRKFLAVTFLSIFIVVGVIVGWINLFNHTNTMSKHHTTITRLLETDGYVNSNIEEFETSISRYIVIIDVVNGTPTIRQGTIEQEHSLDEIVSYILNNDKSGSYENYSYGTKETTNGNLIILSSFERDNQLSQNFFYNSLFISLIGIIVVYIILFFSSSYILKPFIINERNQKEFITNASHELRTPITIIKANLDVLQIDNINNEWTQSIGIQANRLEALTNNLITLSKVEETNDKILKTDFSLTDSILEEFSSYKLILKEKNINFTIDIKENISCYGNEKQIRDVIKLLLDNIVKYSTNDMKIYNDNKEIYFTNSTNLPDGNYDYMFNRFTRMDDSRNQDITGYGIGLSIVKKILENHNCSITAFVNNNVFTIKIKL